MDQLRHPGTGRRQLGLGGAPMEVLTPGLGACSWGRALSVGRGDPSSDNFKGPGGFGGDLWRWTWWAGSGPVFLSPRGLVMDCVEVHRGSRGFQWRGMCFHLGYRKLARAAMAGRGLGGQEWADGEPLGLRAPRGQGFDTPDRAGAQWIGVPGELRGYAEAHRRHGRLPWAQLFTPTIALLRGDFRVPTVLASFLHSPFLRPALTKSSLRCAPVEAQGPSSAPSPAGGSALEAGWAGALDS